MRAFMSTPGDGPIYYDGDTLAHADGRTFAAPYTMDAEAIRLATFAAEREALRILAETEPRYIPARRKSLWDESGALAEALAALVGEGE